MASGDPRRLRQFRPSRHGYVFSNNFDLADIHRNLPATVRRFAPNSSVLDGYGLCGGMTFSAADFFEAGVTIPRLRSAPRPGSDLYKFILERQIASFGAAAAKDVLRVVEWMKATDATVEERTAKKVRKVVETLQAGKFAPLYLIRVRSNRGNPWDNHQVIAYGYRDRTASSAKCVELKIYDPNYPLADGQVVEVRFVNSKRVTCRQLEDGAPLSDEPIRGFFTRSYSARKAAATRLAG